MRLKLKPILLGTLIAIGLFLARTSFSTDSIASWYLGTIKSELWAATQQLNSNASSLTPDSFIATENKASIFPGSSGEGKKSNPAPESQSFPLGWYNSIDYPDSLEQIATEEINFVVPYTGKSNAEEVKAYLDRALETGIKVLVEIPRLEVRRDHRWLIAQFVRKLKTHPALYGWYLYDEPEYVKLSPHLLKRVYNAIKTEDPKHTVAIAFGKLNRIEKYLQALDTVIYFNYPCYSDSPQFCNLENSVFRKLTANVAQFIKAKDNFWMVLQGYGEDKYGQPTQNNRRLPSFEEERYMIYSSILARANGLLFWTHYRSQQPWIDSVLTPLLQELKEYLPTLTSRQTVPKANPNSSQIQARLFRNPQNNSLLLIALNQGAEEIETAIALQPRIRVKSVRVLREDREIAFQNGRLIDRFEPFAVHVYQLQSD